MSSVLETLSSEQVAALLPLLPALMNYVRTETTSSSSREVEGIRKFTNEEMFARKKNSCSTAAQTYLLVSGHYVMNVCGFKRNVVLQNRKPTLTTKQVFVTQSVCEIVDDLVGQLARTWRFSYQYIAIATSF